VISADVPDLTSWTPAAVVFDCDGLLVDTEPCWTIAETELFADVVARTDANL
jgi:beta-phosphoglucomutase-like phosphatase (HAD superfamily)